MSCKYMGCSSLASVIIPNSITSLSPFIFEGCRSLKSVTIGSGVTKIGNRAFVNCEELLDVFCYAESVPNTNIDAFMGAYPEYVTLHVPNVSLEAYRTTTPWKLFKAIVPLDGDEPQIVEKCATPTITYANGKVKFACETEDVQYVPTVSFSQQQLINGNELAIGGTFTVSVYAVKEGYENSDTATTTINMSQMGDVNADGELNAADITAVVNAILGK